MKYKELRLFIDDLTSWLRGYRFAVQKYPPVVPETWHPLGIFSTTIRIREELGPANENRIANMESGCSLIDCLVLEPGEVFSFRRAVGEPTSERGFLPGPMITGEVLSLTTGGGLCQVTTTLFNAALFANVQILEKHNHSRDIWGEDRLIDLGRDAVCVYGRKDLKFRNSTRKKVILRISVNREARKVECQILSEEKPEFRVEVTSRIIKKLAPRSGKKPDDDGWLPIEGWIVRTERQYDNGRVSRRTYSKRETYKPGWRKIG